MNILQAQEIVAAADVIDKVALISGKHGIGKSEIVRQYAKAKDMYNETMMMSLMDTGDLCGIPRTAEIGGQVATVWAAPQWFTNIVNKAWPNELKTEAVVCDPELAKQFKHEATITRGRLNDLYCHFYNIPNDGLRLHYDDRIQYKLGQRSVLFLDEFNRAPADVLNASLQLILDKRLNSHVLPRVMGKETLVVAAINPADGDYTTSELDPALLDRFIYVEAEADLKVWVEYAKSANVNPIVVDYLLANPKFLHSTPKAGGVGTTPRSWDHMSKFLNNINAMPKSVVSHYMKGVLGEAVAAQFLMYYNNYSKALSPKDIAKAVHTAAKKTSDMEELAKPVAKLIEDQEPIQLTEMADKLAKEFASDEKYGIVYLTYLYALPAETLSGYIQSLKKEPKDFKVVVDLDAKHNNKQLFKKLLVIAK